MERTSKLIQPSKDDFINAARSLCEKLLPVFPCRPASKEPAISAWPERASLSLDDIESWWSRDAKYNLGVALPANVVVIDLDRGSRARAERAIGQTFPATMSVRTPGKRLGGVHLYYSVDPGLGIKNRVSLLEDVDVRTRGGYVLAPPSVHPEGGIYSFGTPGIDHPIVPAPDWLIDLLVGSKVRKEGDPDPVPSLEEMLRGVPRGMQRLAMFRYACSRRSKRYDAEEIKAILWSAAQTFDQDRSRPWKRVDIDKLVDDVWMRYEAVATSSSSHLDGRPGRMWTPGELASHPFATDKWIVKPLLRRGVTILSSHAKTGKSMLVATLLKSIALGEPVWGQFETKKTGVLCLDLEQDEDAAADRWKAIRNDNDLENLKIFFSWPRMDKGGLDSIRTFLLENANIGVVVIDTWAMFNPAGPSDSSAGLNEYYREYDVLGQLKRLASEFSCAIIVVHHFSKSSDRPSGTVAFEGAPDGDWRLHRESGSRIAVLKVKGKNTPETEISFNVDLRTYAWEVTGVK